MAHGTSNRVDNPNVCTGEREKHSMLHNSYLSLASTATVLHEEGKTLEPVLFMIHALQVNFRSLRVVISRHWYMTVVYSRFDGFIFSSPSSATCDSPGRWAVGKNAEHIKHSKLVSLAPFDVHSTLQRYFIYPH